MSNEVVQKNWAIIKEFIEDYKISINIDPDLESDILNSIPELEESVTNFPLNKELWRIQYQCKVCKNDEYSPEEEFFALICSAGCFQEYYETNSYFKNRVIELSETLNKLVPALESWGLKIEEMDEEGEKELFEKLPELKISEIEGMDSIIAFQEFIASIVGSDHLEPFTDKKPNKFTEEQITGPPQSALKIVTKERQYYFEPIEVIRDMRLKNIFTFKQFANWVKGVKRRDLKSGHYTVKGWEKKIAIQVYPLKKLVTDLATPTSRQEFVSNIKQLTRIKNKAIIIESNLTTLKTPYSFHPTPPNAIVGSIIALIARWRIPIIFADTQRLAEEITASLLSKYAALEELEKEGNPRQFVLGDI